MLADSYKKATFPLAGNGPRQIKVLKEALALQADEKAADQYGNGAVIEEFEQKMAKLLGKEAAVFFPSGTMAQQIALRIWSDRAGCMKVAYHPLCHLEIHEQEGLHRLHGIEALLLGEKHRLIQKRDLENMKETVSTVLLELPQREIGGQLSSYEELQELVSVAREKGAKLHMDGARLFEALPHYGLEAKELCGLFDSVYISFYKGLGGIAGAILAGDADFVQEAKIWKRRHGGDLISLYPYIIAADRAYELRHHKMGLYKEYATLLAAEFASVPNVRVVPKVPVTNMFHVHWHDTRENIEALLEEVATRFDIGVSAYLREVDPHHYMFEISLGDQFEAVPKETLQAAFDYLVKAYAVEKEPLKAEQLQNLVSTLDEMNQEKNPGQEIHHMKLCQGSEELAAMEIYPYQEGARQHLFSLSKSFTSMAIGIACEEGLLQIDDWIGIHLAKYMPKKPCDYLKRLTIRHLLMMAAGHARDSAEVFSKSRKWTKDILAFEMDHEPGTRFIYNTGATYILSVVIHEATGMDLFDYLTPRLFEPLGMSEAKWEKSPEGFSTGGYGLYLNTQSILRFGQLLLQHGKWEGRQLIPKDWILEATSKQIDNRKLPVAEGQEAGVVEPDHEWNQGYGYQFWRCTHGAFRGDGAFGQYCLCLPHKNVVIAVQSAAGDMGNLLQRICKGLEGDATSEDGSTKNQKYMSEFSTLKGEGTGTIAEELSTRTYVFEENPLGLVKLKHGKNPYHLTLTLNRFGVKRKEKVHLEHQAWGLAKAPDPNFGSDTAGCYAWTEEGLLRMQIRYLEEPFVMDLTAKYAKEKIVLRIKGNVGFDQLVEMKVKGKLANTK